MMIRPLMALEDAESAKYRPYINTGGPLDIINGKFMAKEDGGWALSGGCGASTAVIGGPNTFKSSLLNSSMINAAARFPGAQIIPYDTEYAAIDPVRLAGMSNLYLNDVPKRQAHIDDLIGRMTIKDPTMDETESLDAYFDLLKTIRDEKIKNYKDFEVECEIIDRDTGKPFRMLIPTFTSADSWTEAHVRQLNVKSEEFTADTEMKDQRTINLEEAWQKARLMRQLPSIAIKGGFYTFMTGHLGKKFAVGVTPNKKDMQYMGQDEAVKAMGNKFNFLMSSIFKISNTFALTDKSDKKVSEYPSKTDHIAGNELQQLAVTLVRCKNAPSGTQTQLVSSQRFGIMPGLSYYDYLRNNKYFGLGSSGKVRSPFLGDLDIGRTKIFDQSRDPKIERVLELTYQLFMIQSTWTLLGQPVDYSIPIETFVEKLHQSNYAVDDILNSRGWWTYKGAGFDQPFLTLPDIIMMLDGTYKPKLFPVKSA